MTQKMSISKTTRNNWLIDCALFSGAVVAALSGIYFLYLPIGGYQGGRNPTYGIKILFERATWDDLHTWGGILMIAMAVIHIIVHWGWITGMTLRAFKDFFGQGFALNARSRFNFGLNVAIGIGFLITAISGLYFFFVPGGRNGVLDPGFIFNRLTWDLIHTWAGILLVSAAVLHFAIHWKWVTKVTSKIITSWLPITQTGTTPKGAQVRKL